MILERIGARRWVPIIMAAWGATVALAVVSTPLEFCLIRFFIGFAEAGFFPGVVLFMTYWLPTSHRGRMMALFMTGLAISGVVGGPICGVIMEFLDGYVGMAGWQWLMVATGLPGLAVGMAIYLLLTDRPEQACWLSERERQVLEASLGRLAPPQTSVKARLLNFWSWNSAWIFFLLVCGGYGVSFWMPTLFSQAGVESSASIGLLVAVPNLLGVIAMLLICRHSDRTQERRWHLAACFFVAAIGYAVIASQLESVIGLLIGLSIAHVGSPGRSATELDRSQSHAGACSRGGGYRHRAVGWQPLRLRRAGVDRQVECTDRQPDRRLPGHRRPAARRSVDGTDSASAPLSDVYRWGRHGVAPLIFPKNKRVFA